MKTRFFRKTGMGMLFFFLCVFAWCCGYSKEEKARMEAIRQLGEENAVSYVEEKYGFTPEVDGVEICMEREDGEIRPWANGYVLARLRRGEETFNVHISGEAALGDGRDDFQRELIIKEGRDFFQDLLGYEIYDMYLEYGKDTDSPAVSCHGDGMILEMYASGGFEQFLQEHPVNVRIDDCGDRDLTKVFDENPHGAQLLGEYARKYGMKAIVISYKSREDYENGYRHTYGSGGVMEFGIWDDGLYINSYGVFKGDDQKLHRFELQQVDGLIFGCIDKKQGDDLMIRPGARQWMDLGETKGEPASLVYSVDRDEMGEVTIFIPVRQYGRFCSVFIQHFNGDQWRQYEPNKGVTKDKEYVFVTYHGIPDSHFDLAVFGGGS